MGPTIGLVFLVAMPAALMATAHLFAVVTQDNKKRYVVVLDERVHSAERVAQQHCRQYKVVVDRLWDGSVKGYSGLIPVRSVDRLREDSRVRRIEER